MPEPRRPDPPRPFTGRLRDRVAVFVEGRRLRRATFRLDTPVGTPPQIGDPSRSGDERRYGSRRSAGVFPVLIAVGSACLALGGLWAWQSWSSRSAAPVDDVLPFLVIGEDGEAAATDAPDATAEAGSGQDAAESSTTPAPAVTSSDDAADDHAVGIEGPGVVAQDDPPSNIVVHVSGAVRRPGVVTLSPDARVFEAIDLAGGAADDADLDRVNLAAPLVDGERVHVPAEGEEIPELVEPVRPVAPAVGDATPAPPPVVDINTASMAELETLPGVGPSIAAAIVQTRQDRGPFLSVDELLEVPGIGESKLAQIRPLVVVGR